jgi:cyclic beta-1,2-glucan synthetase
VQNLKRLAGWDCLAITAITRRWISAGNRSVRAGREALKRGVIIEAYMAHHQGMAFLALTNFLHGNPFPRRFHSDSRVRAFEACCRNASRPCRRCT